MDDQKTSTESLGRAFEALKSRVLLSRRTFINIENVQLARGVEQWPLHLQHDFFVSYAALSCVARVYEEIVAFEQPPLHCVSFDPLLATLRSLLDGWSFSASKSANYARLINCCVVTISVLVAAVLVFVPEGEKVWSNQHKTNPKKGAALFPSGASTVVVVVFIHSSSGFGSSLKNSRERLV